MARHKRAAAGWLMAMTAILSFNTWQSTQGQTITLTPSQTEGPYYGPNSPLKPDFRPDVDATTPANWPDLHVTGRVTNQYGVPIANSKVDLWHADATGAYDESSVPPVSSPVTYTLRGHVFTNVRGEYDWTTIMPGLYRGRTRHIHVKIFDGTQPTQELLTTQMYFASPYDIDANFDGAGDINGATTLAADGVFRNNFALYSPLLLKVTNDPKSAGFFDTTLDFAVSTNDRAPRGADLNGNDTIDASDLAQLYRAVQESWPAPAFDLSSDGQLTSADLAPWLSAAATANGLTAAYAYGDANLDGHFNSTDLVDAFQYGEYEDGVADNSNWSRGDWNMDFDFDSADFVVAFQQGTYEQSAPTAVAAVPEPTSCVGLLTAGLLLACHHRCSARRQAI